MCCRLSVGTEVVAKECILPMVVRTNILYLNIDRGGTKTILGPAGALRAPAGKKEWLCDFSLAVPLFHHQWIIKDCRHCYSMGLTEAQPIIPSKVLWPILSTCIYMYLIHVYKDEPSVCLYMLVATNGISKEQVFVKKWMSERRWWYWRMVRNSRRQWGREREKWVIP